MNSTLARQFTFASLLRFSAPTIVMMVFMSLYTMVDGIFVSRMIGTSALSAVNIVFPVVGLIVAVAVMLATGASAIVAREMGLGHLLEAKVDFTFITCVGAALGGVITVAGFVFFDPLLRFLGANDAIYDYCAQYAYPLLWFSIPAVLQLLFQTFFVTAGKPGLGLFVTALGGIANIVLDYVLIGPMDMGIAGAAIATGISYSIPAVYGLVYFLFNKRASLHFVRPKWKGHVLLQACLNGSSEMVTNLSNAVVTYLFNIIMMRYLGEDGVAAITIVLYAQYLLSSVYLGYSIGVAPVISYNYGRQDLGQLRRIFRYSIIFIGVSSALTFGASLWFAPDIARVFASDGNAVFDLTVGGFYLFSACFLFMGANIFASSMFTAFSNGRISAIISLLRTFVFILIGFWVLPPWLGVNGIWLSVPFGELLGFFVSLRYFFTQKQVYHYA